MSNKAWGGRFKKEQDPRVVTFNASLKFDHELFPYDIQGSKAHAAMLAKQNLITASDAHVICEALDAIYNELTNGLHQFDETCEDIHLFIERLLIQKTGDIGKKLHTGRSRNDQVALDLRLYTRDKSSSVIDYLLLLVEQFNKLAVLHSDHWLPGYTHLQQAQPICLAWFFDAYGQMFLRDISRFQEMQTRMNYSPLGAGALAGSNLPLDRAFVAETLGFTGVITNTLDAVSDRDFVIESCANASLVMMHLSRLSEDLILWATSEFNFITLDDAFSTGSSLMPNKKNPDVLELTRGKSGRVYGHLMAMLTMMKGLPLAYNKDMQEDKEALFDTFNTLIACLSVITPFLNSITFNTDYMGQQSKSGFMNATEVLESLVLKGVPFRDAHHQVGLWVAKAMEQGCLLTDLIEE